VLGDEVATPVVVTAPLKRPNRANKTGTTIMLSIVEVNRPPRTTTAIGA
jgi:hypothetical protein